MNILITGANGQLGQHLVETTHESPFQVTAMSRNELDITRLSELKKVWSTVKPHLVINAAAYTQVDKAESDEKSAFLVNETGAQNLAISCKEASIPLIHISTDYVFNGKNMTPYKENDSIDPIGVYGQSKAAGESAISKILNAHIIIRTSWLYGLYGHNFVKTILRLAKEKETLQVVDDQYGTPTYAGDLAKAVWSIAHQITHPPIAPLPKTPWGIYHYSGKGKTSWFSFAKKIVEITKEMTPLRAQNVLPVTSDEYKTPAKRPSYSLFNTHKIEQVFDLSIKHWEESLKEALSELLKEDQIL